MRQTACLVNTITVNNFAALLNCTHSLTICSFFRIALLPCAGKELTSWLSAYAVLLNAVLIGCVPFPFGVWGRTWNSIVSVPDRCRFIYLYTPNYISQIYPFQRQEEGVEPRLISLI